MPDPFIPSLQGLDFTPHSAPFPSPQDWRDHILYELMIDRFDDHRLEPPAATARTPRRTAPPDPRKALSFQGGTLRGITRRLDYLKDLGISALWISPPLKQVPGQNASYHGYAAQNFLSIDPHFGTTKDLQYLVRQAHKRGIYVIMDIVIDHTGDVWAYPNDADLTYDNGRRHDFGFWRRSPHPFDAAHPGAPFGPDDAVWPVELQTPDAFRRMGRMKNHNATFGSEATDADFEHFKDLDLSNTYVLDTMVAIYKYWIAVADLDGFRIDAFRHVRPDPARLFVRSIREYALSIGKKNFLLFGEIAAGSKESFRYIGLNTPLPHEAEAHYPQLDAVLDFDLYQPLDDVLKGRKPAAAVRTWFEFLDRYFRDFGQAGKCFVTFLENHDQVWHHFHRFLYDAPDPRLALLGSAFLLTSLGIPCLYYGTEQGFNGGGDNDVFVRESMFGGPPDSESAWGAFNTAGHHFFNPTHPLYRGISQVARIRREHPALRYGRQYFRQISGDGHRFGHAEQAPCTLAWSRILDTTEIVVALNLSPDTRTDSVTVDRALTPPGTTLLNLYHPEQTTTAYTAPDGRTAARLTLPPYGLAILAKSH
ncbi:MAG TPA: alpha-amylase family glycosyl hydrolase [Phycisphaerae bacterium]|nr:alpha-amylase family glycosyl hydrolase [Phycisphaerae bacterium]